MKKVILATLLAILVTSTAYAHTITNITEVTSDHNTSGIKIDAPNLVQLSDNWTLGAEGGKEIVSNLFYDHDYFEADKGYFGYVKFTYTGTLFSLNK